MRKYKGSIIAAAVLALCLAGWFAVSRMESSNRYNTETERGDAVNIGRDKIKMIEFESADDDFTLEQKDGKILLDGRDEIDEKTSEQLLKSLLKIDGRLIAENCSDDDLAQYGADNPAARVRYITENGETALSLGKATPSKTEYYVIRDDGAVFSVYMGSANALGTKRWQFMDMKLFSLPYEDIAEIKVEGSNAFTAVKQSAGVWKVLSENEGEYEVTDEKMRSEAGLYSENMFAKRAYRNTAERRAEYGLENPEGAVTFTGKNGASARFEFRVDLDKKEAAVIKNGGDTIYITVASYFGMSDIKKEDLT